MTHKKSLVFLRLHLLNYIPAFIAYIFSRDVYYWKSSGIPHFFRLLFYQIDVADYVSLDEWQLFAQEGHEKFSKTIKELSESLEEKTYSFFSYNVDLRENWLQLLAYLYDEHFRFMHVLKKMQEEKNLQTTCFASTYLYQNREIFRLYFPSSAMGVSSFYAALDGCWFWVVAIVRTLRYSFRLLMMRGCISAERELSTVKYVFSGIGPSELAEEDEKLDFLFLINQGLLKAEECFFIIPKKPTKKLRMRLNAKKVKWALSGYCVSSRPFVERLKILGELWKILWTGCMGWKAKRKADSFFLPMMIEAVLWVAFALQFKPKVWIASQSASWPEEIGVGVMNAFQIRTVNWFYSTNNYGIAADSGDFRDRCLENSIWVAREICVWSESVKDWLADRKIMPNQTNARCHIVGPIMCGNFQFLEDNGQSRTVRQLIKPDKKYIVIFDVPTVRKASRIQLGLGPLIYNSAIAEKFYEDISQLLLTFPEVGIILKPKRSLGDSLRSYPPSLWKLLEQRWEDGTSDRIIVLPHAIDPYLALSLGYFFIGLPFTSPVLFGLRSGCRSLYHDPLKTFNYFFPTTLKKYMTKTQYELIETVRGWLAAECDKNTNRSEVDSLDCSYFLGTTGDPAVSFSEIIKNGINSQEGVKNNNRLMPHETNKQNLDNHLALELK